MTNRSPPWATSGPGSTRAGRSSRSSAPGPRRPGRGPTRPSSPTSSASPPRPDAPFKLTGGLHHAVRGTYPVDGAPEEHHGILNVLLATAAAGDGAGDEEVAALLALRDGEALAELVRAWPDATAARVRRAFTSYGCCTVTDPVGELADLGLLDRPCDRPDRPDQPDDRRNRHDLARPARRPPVRRPQPAVRRLLHPGCRPARRRPRGRRGARRRGLRGAGRDGVRCRLARAVAQPLPRGGAPGVDRGARVAHRAADERGTPHDGRGAPRAPRAT